MTSLVSKLLYHRVYGVGLRLTALTSTRHRALEA